MRVVAAAYHRPVGGIWRFEHRIGYWYKRHIVIDIAGDSNAFGCRRLASLTISNKLRGIVGDSEVCRGCKCGGDRIDAVGFEYMCGNGEIVCVAYAFVATGRHVRFNITE